ncbi:MAG: hypothetical protein PHT59_05800 [Candidatus Omnitrophica bacterium]|nr:hypothetical protein [Candidatus Omnitrophota bacterium]
MTGPINPARHFARYIQENGFDKQRWFFTIVSLILIFSIVAPVAAIRMLSLVVTG